uniref:Integrase catalytic domain-containing protein n=1 Tax=Tanacetum cinerariifolium TaxID=118510 RepID=A0A6L2KQY1_TANCI|nr:hypothetical protein [Tanacetum cinerariifolium]GEV58634.1 hypothetical protein [Tanacetum cinerariifolium]
MNAQNLIKSLQNHSYKGNKYSWIGEILKRKGKVVVGNDPELRKELVQHFHDEVIGGHSVAHATMKKLGSLFYWKGLKKMVKQMIRDCDVCQREALSAYPGLIQPIPIPKRIWKEIPWISLKTSQVAQVFLDQVYKLHGLPESIVSDRDRVFLSNFWKALFAELKVKLKLSTAYHPQTDGQTEVVNRSLGCYLRCMCGEKPKEWVKWLPLDHSVGVLPQLREDGLLENKPMAILERRLGKVNNKPVMFMLIQWTNKSVEEATWEIYGDLITRDDYDSRRLNIYEMRNGYSEWSLKYLVDHDDFRILDPTTRICNRVWFIILGDKEEDTNCMVFENDEVILLLYKIVSKITRELCELPLCISDDSFQFTGSFAGV